MAFDVCEDFSEFYDLYVGDWLDDLPLYLECAKPVRGPVLEIGAGSGRLTVPLAREGASVVAVDVSASMLTRLRRRLAQEPDAVQGRVQVVEADACELNLRTKHELVIVPFYTFNYFLIPQRQQAALERVYRHLQPPGSVLLDVFVPLSRIENCPAEPVLRIDRVDPLTGNRVRVWNAYSIDREQQIETRRHFVEVTEPDGKVRRKEFSTRRRYSFHPQMEGLFRSTGFRVKDAFRGYRRKRADASSEQLLYVLGKV